MTQHHSPEQIKREIQGFSLIVLAVLGISLQAVLAKMLFASGVSFVAVLVLRKLMFLSLYTPLLLRRFKPKAIYSQGQTVVHAMMVGALGHYILPLITFHALDKVNAGVVTVIVYTYPLFVILLNALLFQIFPPALHIFTFLAMQVGVYWVMGGGTHIFEQNLEGSLLALLVSVLYAMFTMTMHRAVARLGTRRYIFHALMGGLLASVVHFLLAGAPIGQLVLSGHNYAMLALFSLICFVPALFVAEGMQVVGVTRASLITAMAPALTIILAYFMLHEVLLPLQMLGSVVVIAAVLLLEKKLLKQMLPKNKRGKVGPS